MINYLKSVDINRDNYNKDDLSLLEPHFQDNNILWKECKTCKIILPVNKIFFRTEKRLPDGHENKCRKCKYGKFLSNTSKIGVPSINAELKEKYNNDIIKLYEHYLLHNEVYQRTFIEDNYKYILKYLIEIKYKMKDNEIVLISRDWLQSYKFYGILLRKYNGRICDLIDYVYPNRFKPWQFITVGRAYWNDETRKEALDWFIHKIFNDKIVNTVDEIPEKIGVKNFHDYSLGELLKNRNVYSLINEIYPNKFYEWEFISHDYWQYKENRIVALKQLFNKLNINIDDIPRIISFEFFDIGSFKHNSKFRSVLCDYYNYDIYSYINECYPDRFKRSEFAYQNHYPTLDNIIVKSEPERIIHHIFIKSGLSCKYGNHSTKFHDNENSKSYIPDWLIYKEDKIIIVEYYGMLGMNESIEIGYKEKHTNKHKFYNDLCNTNENYLYIDLYIEDIKRDLTGLKNKFDKLGIDLIIE